MPISVASPTRASGLRPALAAVVRAVLAAEGRRPGDIAIVLSDDAELRALNRRWRGIDRATDVLSFAYDEMVGEAVSGDLVVSLDRVTAQARRYRVSAARELVRLVVHGTLHLAGHDHAREPDRRRMRLHERRAMHASAGAIRALEGRWPAPRRASAARA